MGLDRPADVDVLGHVFADERVATEVRQLDAFQSRKFQRLKYKVQFAIQLRMRLTVEHVAVVVLHTGVANGLQKL